MRIIRTSWMDLPECEFKILAQRLGRIMMPKLWCSFTTWRII